MFSYELEEEYKLLHSFIDGWKTAKLTDEQIDLFKKGKLNSLDLDWY